MTWTIPGQPEVVLNESDISHRGQDAERRLGNLTSEAPVV